MSILITRPFEGMNIPAKYSIDQWNDVADITREEFLKRARGKDALLITPSVRIDKELLDAAGPNLKVVSTHSVGYDHIDVEECHRRGILIGHTPDVLTEAMAELTIALTLATIRRFPEATRALQNGQWFSGVQSQFWMCGSSIKDSIVGFIGAGRIGQEIMKCLVPFKPIDLLYNTRNRNTNVENLNGAKYVSLEEVCSKSDILIVICSLNSSTKHLIGRKQFELMKSNAILINTSRGAVIDQEALYDALKSGKIAGAGLDVMQDEPIPLDDPLLELDNVLLLPHIGSATRSTRKAMLELAINNAISGIENRPLLAQIK